MRIAFIFDVHGNLPALRAVLGEIEREGADLVLHGGDLVGWGPEPEAVVSMVAERDIRGVVGNHELLCQGIFTEDNALRNQSTAWTASALSESAMRFVSELPSQIVLDDCLLSHANPAAWREPPDASCFPYLHGGEELLADKDAFADAPGATVVTGHLHVAAVYAGHLGGRAVEVREMDADDYSLECSLNAGEWLFVTVGAVGKPRDGVPAANFAIMDTTAGTIVLRRVQYDVKAVCERIRNQSGLPDVLADELAQGL